MLKNRHALKKKEIKNLKSQIEEIYSCKLSDDIKMEVAKLFDLEVILVDNAVDFIFLDSKPLFTLTSIEKYQPKRKFVTVDKGAVRFVTNGADVMVPGIVDADRDIKEKDPVWIREETYGKAIAVGISMMNGDDLIELEKGKGIKNIHWIGDKIWRFTTLYSNRSSPRRS